MSALLDLWLKEPVRVIGFITALLALAAIFGLPITPDQSSRIIDAVVALIVLLGGAEVARSQVTPVAAPSLQLGAEVTTPIGGSAVVVADATR